MIPVEHVNVKVYAEAGAGIDWHLLIPVFHRWIQQQAMPDLLPFDVADYSHVPEGPGVMLIGHHATISLDNRQNRLGLLFNRRTVLPGEANEKIRHSVEGALAAARRLAAEPEFRGGLVFDEEQMECFVNDRLLAPNTENTWQQLRPALEAAFPGAHLTWLPNPKELFRVKVDLAKVESLRS